MQNPSNLSQNHKKNLQNHQWKGSWFIEGQLWSGSWQETLNMNGLKAGKNENWLKSWVEDANLVCDLNSETMGRALEEI